MRPVHRPRLLLVTGPIIASTQIRCAFPFTLLTESGVLEWRRTSLAEVSSQSVRWPDVAVFNRIATPATVELLAIFQGLGVKTVYELDDDFLNIEDSSNLRLYRHYRRPEVRRAVARMLRRADVLVVSTDRLARLAGSYNGHVRKIENCVNFDLLTGVAPPVPVKEVVIGFAGTPHRERDFQFVTPALERLLSRYGDKVKLHFMGFVPETLADRPEVVFEDFRLDYSAFFRRLASSGWHVGLAPLEDCESKFAKSDVKFKEYAACRIAGVYSDVPPYQGVIDSQLGLRVRNEADDWYEAIRRLVDDRDLTDGITARAFAHVRRNWGMERAAMEWQAVLGEILPASETRGAVDDRAMEGSLARFERLRDGRTTGPGRLLQVVKRRVQDSPRLYGLLRGIKHRLLKP